MNVTALDIMPTIKLNGKNEFDIFGIVNIFKEKYMKDTIVILEKAAPRPISGKRACFMTGGGYYLMQGILSSLNIPYEIVTPQLWQKTLLKGLKENTTKEASIKFCQQRFPYIDLTKPGRSKKPHDGLADALCMALYCLRINGRIQQ